jgi:hypothetical protein
MATAHPSDDLARQRALARAHRYAPVVLLLLCVAVVAVGLVRDPTLLRWPLSSAETARSLWALLAIPAIAGAFALGHKLRLLAVVVLPLAWLVVANGLWAVMAVLLMGVSAFSIGELVLRDTSDHVPRTLNSFLKVSIGLAIMVWAVSLMALMPVNYHSAYVSMLVIPIFANVAALRSHGGVLLAHADRASRTISLGEFLLLWTVLLTAGLLSVYAALPERGADALTMHLYTVTSTAFEHRWNPNATENLIAVTPQGANWLYLIGYLLAEEPGAKLVNLGLVGVAAGILGSLIAHLHGRIAAWLTTALYLSIPLVAYVTQSLFAENALTLFVTALVALLICGEPALERRQAVALGLLCGAALQIKLHGFLVMPAMGILLLWSVLTAGARRREAVVALSLCCATAAAVGLVPYAVAYTATGNPVFPFFNAVFKSPLWSPINFSDPLFAGKWTWDILYRWTFRSSELMESGDGLLGLAILLLLPAGLVAGAAKRDAAVLISGLVVLVFLALLWPFSQYVRYAAYVIPIVLVACAGVLHVYPTEGPRGTRIGPVVAALVLIGTNMILLPRAVGHVPDPVDVADPSRRKEWIRIYAPERLLNEELNLKEGRNARVLFVDRLVGAGLMGHPLYLNWHSPLALSVLADRKDAAEVEAGLHTLGMTHVVMTAGSTSPFAASLRTYLLAHGLPAGEVGTSILYELPHASARFEKLTNTDFRDGLAGWIPYGSVARSDEGEVTIPPGAGLAQILEVPASRFLQYTVELSCGEERGVMKISVVWATNGAPAESGTQWVGCMRNGAQVRRGRFRVPEGVVRATLSIWRYGEAAGRVRRISATLL